MLVWANQSLDQQAGLKLTGIFAGTRCPVLYPFARFDYYNTQKECAGLYVADKRNEVRKWTAGINWFALPNLVVKADYATRQIGTSKIFGKWKYNSENEFSIGVAYVGWFTKR